MPSDDMVGRRALRSGFMVMIAAAAFVGLSAWCACAHAYRPFESTDADVIDPGLIEIELGPVAYTDLATGSVIEAPTVTINAGLSSRWEVVIDATRAVARSPTTRNVETFESALLFKGVLREGALQEASGWSIATELGVLVPTRNLQDHYGATIALIGSHRSEGALLHLNGAVSKNRDGHAEFFGGLILEGSPDTVVRPVGELTFNLDGETDARSYSALVGAIWRPTDTVSFDVAMRAIREDHTWGYQGRIGVTWAFAVVRT